MTFIYVFKLIFLPQLCVWISHVSKSPSAGEAVAFTARYLLAPAAGRRPMVPGIVVIIGDKKSSDNLTVGTSNLRAAGAIGQISVK